MPGNLFRRMKPTEVEVTIKILMSRKAGCSFPQKLMQAKMGELKPPMKWGPTGVKKR